MAERRRWPGLIAVIAVIALALGLATFAWPDRTAPDSEPPDRQRARDRIAGAELARCPDAPAPVVIGGSIELALFLGPGVDPVRADEVRSAVARFWGDYGILVGDAEVREIDDESMFTAGFAELEPLRGDPQATGERLYRELRTFMIRHGYPRHDRINLVLLRDVVHPRAAAAAVLGDLIGLTLAPELLDAGDPAAAAVLAALDLPGPFTPTVLLSDRHLSHMDDAAFVAAVAHETGHALGLVHIDPRANLMAVGEHDCLPGLEPGQRTTIAASPIRRP